MLEPSRHPSSSKIHFNCFFSTGIFAHVVGTSSTTATCTRIPSFPPPPSSFSFLPWPSSFLQWFSSSLPKPSSSLLWLSSSLPWLFLCLPWPSFSLPFLSLWPLSPFSSRLGLSWFPRRHHCRNYFHWNSNSNWSCWSFPLSSNSPPPIRTVPPVLLFRCFPIHSLRRVSFSFSKFNIRPLKVVHSKQMNGAEAKQKVFVFWLNFGKSQWFCLCSKVQSCSQLDLVLVCKMLFYERLMWIWPTCTCWMLFDLFTC